MDDPARDEVPSGVPPIPPSPMGRIEQRLQDLQRRLGSARLPETWPNEDWEEGVPISAIRTVVEYWREQYDPRRLLAELDAAGQSRTVVDGVDLHLLHLRSDRADARPLLLCHGWPGSVVEYLDVLHELTSPPGGLPAFHVVVPSLPGFGLSGAPSTSGWDAARIGLALAELMRRLGYERFLVQGGDWGGVIVTELAARLPERVLGLHTTFPQASPPVGWSDRDRDRLAPEERDRLDRTLRFWASGTAYARIQADRPLTFGYGLVDSPVALLAWVLDRVVAWTDPHRPPLERVPLDRLLDDVTLHWLGGSGASASRIYRESYGRSDLSRTVDVPSAVSVFPFEIEQPPASWVRSRYRDLRRWQVLDRGGHFPSLEEPKLFVDEVRAAFATM